MVERSWLPCIWIVACGAVCTQATGVGINLLVAAGTGSGGAAQGRETYLLLVTSAAVRLGVFSKQGKTQLVMVKGFAIGINAIVTGQAVLPKGSSVFLHIDLVGARMACRASGGYRAGVSLLVAILTGERLFIIALGVPIE